MQDRTGPTPGGGISGYPSSLCSHAHFERLACYRTCVRSHAYTCSRAPERTDVFVGLRAFAVCGYIHHPGMSTQGD
jgi:hypothetical protein